MTAFDIEVSYTQLAVFDPTLDAPFNDWTDEHVAQGFAWRLGSVSFGTLQSAGTIHVEVVISRSFAVAGSQGERVIVVPFTVPTHGELEIASIGSSALVELPPGDYELIYEHGHDDRGIMWAKFYFCPSVGLVVARVLRAGPELNPPEVLVMTAEPA